MFFWVFFDNVSTIQKGGPGHIRSLSPCHLLQVVPLHLDISVIVTRVLGDPVTTRRPGIPQPIGDISYGAKISEKVAPTIVPADPNAALCLCFTALSCEIDGAGFRHQFWSGDAAKIHFPAARGAGVVKA